MGKLTAISFWILATFLISEIVTQQVGNVCVPTDVCIGALHEVCDAGVTNVCICDDGYELTGSQCQAKDCGALTAIANGNILYSEGTVFDSTAFHSCVTGYVLSGDSQRDCQADTTWSGVAPTCGKVDCLAVNVPTNGMINNMLTTYQEEVTFTCTTGYSLSGTATITCLSNGAWSATEPTCSIVDCGDLTAPTNGGLSKPGNTFGEVATFTCLDGYNLVGSTTRTCEAGGLWSNSNPTCAIKDCGTLNPPGDGTVQLQNGVTTFGEVGTFSCNTGYDLVGSTTATCLQTGSWSTGAPTCTIRDCGSLGSPSNGDVVHAPSTTFGSTATFTCDPGYNLNGDNSIDCQADGTWDAIEPTCVIKDCGELTAPTNGDRTYSTSGTTYNTVATFTCNTGFNIVGATTATCQADSTWSANAPICQVVVCSALTTPTSGGLAYSNALNYDSSAVFSCDLGHTMNGDGLLTCQSNGQWNGTEPTCQINQCPSLVPPSNGAISSSTGQNYQATASFTCDVGYDMVGSGTVTCQSDGTWSAAEPVCNIKDCGSVGAPMNGFISATSGTTYLSNITFACNTGYNMNGAAIILCQSDGTWTGNAPTCTIKDCGTLNTPISGSLLLSSQTTYGSVATFSCNVGYTIDGSSILNCLDTGAWDGSEPTCQIVDCGSLTTPANGNLIAPSTTYLATASFQCDDGYTLTGSVNTQCQASGAWTNPEPTCVIKDCGALTAPTNGGMSNHAATTFGTTVTFSCDTGYVLTGATSVQCQTDGTWSDNEPTCPIRDCGSLNQPSDGSVTVTGTTFGETGTFSCNTGYNLVGVPTRTCQADGSWSAAYPTCQINDCGPLPQPSFGTMTTTGGTTYGALAQYTCNLGYTLIGSSTRTCQDDSTWSSTAPNCQINDCGTLGAPANGAVDLSGGTTYLEVATFSCNTGYTLDGDATRTCQDNGDWTTTSPVCIINNCGTLAAPANGAVDLTDGTVYLSVSQFTCDPGYDLTGAVNRTCQADSTWETPSPTCVIKDCGALVSPTDGAVDTSSGTVFQSVASYTCDAGYDLNGVTTRTCTSAGTWDGAPPTCSRKDCGTLTAPVNGTVNLGEGTLFEANATFDCDIGFTLTGSAWRVCNSTGMWGDSSPTCVIKDCGALTSPMNGTVTTASGTTYEEVAVYSCNAGFTLTGTTTRTCQADATWNDTAPTCVIKDCGNLAHPANGLVAFNPNTEYLAFADYTCNIGYTLNGTASRTCLATGLWGNDAPTCDINDCGSLANPSNGLVNLTDGSTYLSVATFTCNIGYTLSGVTQQTCQANSTWSDTSPVCIINDCGTLTAPASGSVDLSDGTVYQSVAIFSCDTGYDLIGKVNRTCLAPGTWETPSPTCQIKDCGTPVTPAFGTLTIPGATTYQSQINYTCDAGFNLNGSVVRTCASDGLWTDSDPNCYRSDCGVLNAPNFGHVNYTNGTLFEEMAEYGCNLGFNLTNGTATRFCQEDATWNGSEPVCVTKDCGALPDLVNGSISTPGGTTFLQTAYFTCETGFTLNGNATRQCVDQGDGEAVWSDLQPTCDILDCGLLANPNFGAVNTSGGTTYGETATYSCITGYQVNGQTQRVCNDQGAWSGDAPTCGLLDCGTPTSIANGAVAYTGGTLYQATATYSCNTGFGIVGTATVTCVSTGLWETIPLCGSDCGTPTAVAQSTVSYPSGTLSGANATYTCDNGYSLSGNATITCSITGSWSNEPFCTIILRNYNETCFLDSQCITISATCRDNGQGADQCLCALQDEYYDPTTDTCLKDCGTLGDPTNGIVTLPSLTVTYQIATYQCNVGFALNGNGTRVCLNTGLWSGNPPTCTTGCGSLVDPDNGRADTSAGKLSGDIAVYTCNTGYTLVGVQERVCLEDSTWNGRAPTCNIECSSLSGINHGTVDLSLGHWDGSIAIYICDKDYALVGTSARVCQSTGLWTGVPPECIFAIFPEILLVFGSLFIFLFIVDIAILSFCLYIRYCRPKKSDVGKENQSEFGEKKDEEEPYPSIFDERPPISVPPLISSTNMPNKKSRTTRITPENTRYHPPPRKPQKLERPLYKYSMKPKTEIPEPEPDQKPNTYLEPLNKPEVKTDLQIEELNKDDAFHSDDSAQRKADSGPEEDQISLFDEPTQPWQANNEVTSHSRKESTLAQEVHTHGNIRARMSIPPVPDPPMPIGDESEKYYSEERRRYLKNTVNAYSK